MAANRPVRLVIFFGGGEGWGIGDWGRDVEECEVKVKSFGFVPNRSSRPGRSTVFLSLREVLCVASRSSSCNHHCFY